MMQDRVVTGMKMTGQNRTVFGTMVGFFAVLSWSIAAPIIVYASDVNSYLFIVVEEFTGFLIFLAYWLHRRINPMALIRQAPVWYVPAGVFGISLHGVLWVVALQNAPPLEATLIIYTWPLMVVVFTALALRRPLRWVHGLGALLGLAGIVVLLSGGGAVFGGLVLVPGHFYAVGCALAWSLFSAASARYEGIDSSITGIILLCGSALCLPLWIFSGAPGASWQSLAVVAVSAVATSLGYGLWSYGMQHGNAQLIGIASFMTPVLASLYLVILGQAAFSLSILLALILVMLGIAAARYGDGFHAA